MRKNQKNFAVSQEEKVAPEKSAEVVAAEIEDVEAEFVDIVNYRRKQKNNLLGVFDGENYIISDEMVARLIDLPKRFDRFESNSMYVSMSLNDFVLNFRIDMEIEPDFCRGQLYFIEIENGIADDSKHVTLLDDVLDVYTPEFRAKLDERWHIFYGVETPAADDFLLRYMKMQLEEVYFCRELVDVLSQLYVTRMIGYVVKMGEKGEEIEREFKEEIEKIAEKDPDIVNKHEEQKEVLDKILRKHEAFEEIVKTEEGRKIMKSFSEPLKKVRDKTYPSVLTEIMNPNRDAGSRKKENSEDKAEVKAGAGKSAKSAPKSGGGGKKSSPKKSKPYVFKPPKLNRTISDKSISLDFPPLFDFVPPVPTDGAAHVAGDVDSIKIVADPISTNLPTGKTDDLNANGAAHQPADSTVKNPAEISNNNSANGQPANGNDEFVPLSVVIEEFQEDVNKGDLSGNVIVSKNEEQKVETNEGKNGNLALDLKREQDSSTNHREKGLTE